MKDKILILLIIILNNCNNKTKNCNLNVNAFLKTYSGKFVVADTSNGKILELIDNKYDTTQNGDYAFYDNGELKSYKFFSDRHIYTYNEEYDINGHLSKVE